jgi:hypothetical protein
MIPSTTKKYLVTEDWKKIFQSYPNAEFQSYDFETLRRTMISYLQENYPEDFNDYIDSSEYLALIDLIAFMGQNLSFRSDLNARENFLETAQRRDSILNLATLIGYNPSRNTPARGFLKILTISTSDIVLDSNGNNLANQAISWNDPTNTNWYDQFVTILNSAMPSGVFVGRPYDSATINGLDTQQYKINSSVTGIPVFNFSGNINGTTMNFEIVSSLFSGQTYVYEEPPKPNSQFSFIYKNDNQGSGSANTGFFVHFKQGSLSSSNFVINQPVPNELISINANGTNRDDVWLWQLDLNGNYSVLWTKVPNLIGNNIIYNSINNQVKNIYSVLTRENDQFNLSFADGNFGNLPRGNFSVFHRQSNGLSYTIRPDQLSNISLSIPYTNKNGQSNTLRLVVGLQESVTNSQTSESDASIKLKAPQSYYVQNRMVTSEDYNIAPLTAGADILKIHSINRLSSGISKYFDLSDVSGEYSNTNIFATDGIIYKQYKNDVTHIEFTNQNDILGFIENEISTILLDPEIFNFYIDKYPRVDAIDLGASWIQSTKTTNQSTGFFKIEDLVVSVGSFSGNNLQYLSSNALIKFLPPRGKYFLFNGELTSSPDTNTKEYVWAQVVSIAGDGSNGGAGYLSDGTGSIVLSKKIPSGSVPSQIIPSFKDSLSQAIKDEIVNILDENRNLGISFDSVTRSWFLITDTNLDIMSPFSLSFQQDTSNLNKDNSWLIGFQWTGIEYNVFYRTLNYIFESEKQTAFFIDNTVKNYDFVNDTVVKDQIVVLSVNETVASSQLTYSTSTNIPILTTSTVGNTYVSPGSTTGEIKISTEWASANNITGNSYYAVNPSLKGVISVINKITTSTQQGVSVLTVASTLTDTISIGDTITFIPISISITNTTTFTPAQAKQTVSLSTDYVWQIDKPIIESDGYVDPGKILVSYFDYLDNGQIDEPDAFTNIVLENDVSLQTGYLYNFVYFKYQSNKTSYNIVDKNLFTAYPTPADVISPTTSTLYYFYDPSLNIIQNWSDETQSYILNTDYFAYPGRSELKFHYVHNSGRNRRLDPGKTNLIDIYLLTSTYDIQYRSWLASGTGTEPMPPTSSELSSSYQSSLDPIKSISDELVFHSAIYKILFGKKATPSLQGRFKAVQNPGISNSTNSLKARIFTAIENFFALENWNFGDTFYFSELATYVMNVMTPDITNFVIVPNSIGEFGSLYEITSQSNEIFINGTTVADIDIIDAITAAQLQTSGSIINSTTGA